jgi:tetratricopeptide (TPR) repeat protein
VLVKWIARTEIGLMPAEDAPPGRVPGRDEPVPALNSGFPAALAAHGQGRLDEAKAGYHQLLQADGGHVDALRRPGVAHLQSGELPEAEQRIHQALALQESAVFFANLGDVLKDSGYPDEAEAAFRRALALKPDYPEALSRLGKLLKTSGRVDGAEVALRLALELRSGYARSPPQPGVPRKKCGPWSSRSKPSVAPRNCGRFMPSPTTSSEVAGCTGCQGARAREAVLRKARRFAGLYEKIQP